MTLPTARDLAKRFWPKVNKDGDCWLWTASIKPAGYGQFHLYIEGKRHTLYAHRVAWEAANGPIPEGQCVLHKCDNPVCVNPGHMFLGSHADNALDKARKMRAAKKLSVLEVQMIRIHAAAGFTQREIAKDFGISQGTVHIILSRKGWAWV